MTSQQIKRGESSVAYYKKKLKIAQRECNEIEISKWQAALTGGEDGLKQCREWTAWERTIVDKYPQLCRQYEGDEADTCMSAGFVFGQGWRDIFERLCGAIVKIDDQIYLTQVKEKFGTLAVYTSSDSIELAKQTEGGIGDDLQERIIQLLQLIALFECESRSTCFVCGEPATHNNTAWILPMCGIHKDPDNSIAIAD